MAGRGQPMILDGPQITAQVWRNWRGHHQPGLVTMPWYDTDVTWSFGPSLHWYWPHISGPGPDRCQILLSFQVWTDLRMDACCHVETVTCQRLPSPDAFYIYWLCSAEAVTREAVCDVWWDAMMVLLKQDRGYPELIPRLLASQP